MGTLIGNVVPGDRLPEHVPHIQPALQRENLKQREQRLSCVVEGEVSTMAIPGEVQAARLLHHYDILAITSWHMTSLAY